MGADGGGREPHCNLVLKKPVLCLQALRPIANPLISVLPRKVSRKNSKNPFSQVRVTNGGLPGREAGGREGRGIPLRLCGILCEFIL